MATEKETKKKEKEEKKEGILVKIPEIKFKEFLKGLKSRLFELILEIISYKTFLLFLVLFYVKENGDIGHISNFMMVMLGTTGVGVYKFFKDSKKNRSKKRNGSYSEEEKARRMAAEEEL